MSGLRGGKNPDLLVGYQTSDDAGVYRIREDLALVQTVDFITPVCDDPYIFGQVAAANSLSDIFAMGGSPLTAMNICCFPASGVPEDVLPGILAGGLDKTEEAGATLVGGHTVRDDELKYGLSVTGIVDPAKVLLNSGARPGDVVVLTKPLGTGILVGGHRKGLVSTGLFDRALEGMARLSDEPSRLAVKHGARACTDVTGFGLAGHALEMARASGCSLRLRWGALPIYEGVMDLATGDLGKGMAASNRQMAGDAVAFDRSLTGEQRAILFDPQTSGGLLLCLPEQEAGSFLAGLADAHRAGSAVVGQVEASGRPIEVTA